MRSLAKQVYIGKQGHGTHDTRVSKTEEEHEERRTNRRAQTFRTVAVHEEMETAQNAEPKKQDKNYYFEKGSTEQQSHRAEARPPHRVRGHGHRTSLPTIQD